LSTWIGKEFTLNLTYGDDKVAFSDYLKAFRALVREETEKKIKGE
jgi:putative hydrolase of HD superfamily